MQIARQRDIDLDVDLALSFASYYCKTSTMECIVVYGNTDSFLGPLMRAAERGCMQVVRWFVERGSKDMELCLALTAAASSSKIDVLAYLLKHVPRHVLHALSMEIMKAASDRSGGSFHGIEYLLSWNFLDNAEATYRLAEKITRSEDEGFGCELKDFLKEHWSRDAFERGRGHARDHYVNMMRVVKRGCSPLCLQDLPPALQLNVCYLPLYKECASSIGLLLPQSKRGQLVEAALQLQNSVNEESLLRYDKASLLRILELQLPDFLFLAGHKV